MLFNTSQVPAEQEKPVKKNYSYKDLVNLELKNLYGSMGKMIDSNKKSSSRATFGKAERSNSNKVLEPFKMAERDNYGRESKGPSAYLPPRYTLQNGETIETKDPS